MKAFQRVLPLLLLLAAVIPGAGKTPVVLSTDVGNEIDDQWAITYLLLNPEFDVQGIISAHAPSLPDPSAHATYEILKNVVEVHLGMVSHPPLLEGSSLPLQDRKTPRPSAGLDFLLGVSKRFSKDHRLTVLTIGAATDVASAILEDPGIVDRINVVAMGFKSLAEGGNEFNVENDPRAWQVILDSDVPVTIGSADVCKANLAMGFEQAKNMVGTHGPIGRWLWSEYQDWYFRNVKPLRKNDFSRPWVIWDTITLAYELAMTTQKVIPRPRLADNLSFEQVSSNRTVTWITSVDSARMWPDFLAKLDAYQETHKLE
ncbi:MAG: nucleoside hydrolase [Acidobacteriaceae bacterium]|nr:nucleoside hydrolase [Acidobacteriaceae bacterium]